MRMITASLLLLLLILAMPCLGQGFGNDCTVAGVWYGGDPAVGAKYLLTIVPTRAGQFVRGVPDGLWRTFDSQGTVASEATWRDGKTPVNVSGGLESKGHPIAATGIANIWEVCHHLRGEAGDRQIEGAKVGLAHVIGLGSACGVHILEKSAL